MKGRYLCFIRKCGFVYHHTNRDILWPRTGEILTEHISRLTKEEWLRNNGTAANRGENRKKEKQI